VIEDDEVLRSYLREMLTMEGYSVIEATEGNMGLAVIKQQIPDIVLTDLVMPVVDGIEFIMTLRKSYNTLPIIAMSGGNTGHGHTYLSTAKALGASAILDKPFSGKVLLDLVERLVTTRES